jgi:hypothetical protein
MNNKHLLRIGGAAAVSGVIVQRCRGDTPSPHGTENRRKGDSHHRRKRSLDGALAVHVTGIVLIVVSGGGVTRTFSEGPANGLNPGSPLFVIAGALGVAEVLVGGSTKHLQTWATAAPDANLSYLAAFEGAWNTP